MYEDPRMQPYLFEGRGINFKEEVKKRSPRHQRVKSINYDLPKKPHKLIDPDGTPLWLYLLFSIGGLAIWVAWGALIIWLFFFIP